jgi:predicted butyrate kinase (DUF1464 family)
MISAGFINLRGCFTLSNALPSYSKTKVFLVGAAYLHQNKPSLKLSFHVLRQFASFCYVADTTTIVGTFLLS